MAKEKKIEKMPLVYAHRGASADRPEHTMEAYEEGLRQGADGFECDVRLTKDNIAILWHDSTMDRTAGATGDIANLSFNEIRDRYPKVATLNELLDFVIKHKKGLLIETKHPVPTSRAIEKTVASMLRDRKSEIEKAGIEISIMSFSWSAVESFTRENSEFNTVMLLNPLSSRIMRRFSSAQTWGPGIDDLKKNPDLIPLAKSRGKRVFVWTVNETADVAFCARTGVDVVITNKPALARDALGYS
jgi:glycerophosphoryl diester phosphodiesterase